MRNITYEANQGKLPDFDSYTCFSDGTCKVDKLEEDDWSFYNGTDEIVSTRYTSCNTITIDIKVE